MNRLAELLEAERAKRDLTLTDFAEQVLGISHSLVSRYVNGIQSPNRRTVRKIAGALGVPVAEIDAMLAEEDAKRRGRHKPGLGPTDDAAELLARIDQRVEAMYRALDRGEVIGAWAGDPPELPPGEAADVPAEERGRLFPVPVADNRHARELPVASVVWIDPAGEPSPGKIVLVDQDGARQLKKYAEGDKVLGVGRLVQWTLP